MTFKSARELDADEIELVAVATRTIDENTDVGPDEDGLHTVGAAVMAGDYRMFSGVNLFHFTGGPCAELVALGAARASGAREIVAIVAVGNGGRGVLAPCGRDRQILADYYPDCRVVLPTADGLRSIVCTDLLPGVYRAPNAVAPLAVDDSNTQVLEFSPRYLDTIRSGAKTRTTRRVMEATPGPVVLLFATDPRTRLNASVRNARRTRFRNLTHEDAQAEGCGTPDELRRLVREHYPDIAMDDEVWVIEFALV